MKSLLVPCDFSDQAREAYKLALDIAEKSKGKITLLHIVEIPVLHATSYVGDPSGYDTCYIAELEQEARVGLGKMKDEAIGRDVRINTKVVFGETINSITNIIEKNNIDLVVMGTSGASGISEIFLGSNAEKVVRHSPVPILVVRHAVKLDTIKNILVPSTLGLDQTYFISQLKELQNFFGATLHVLLVNTPSHFLSDPDSKEKLNEFARHYNLDNYKLHLKDYEDEQTGIMNFASAEHMDIIAMATHARKGLSHLLKGSITEDIVNHIKNMVWTCTIKK